ncbi:hypothetical protein Ddc_02453 [Ditylenchus destructor]|nr:hypothetical protein Ddc_02453 [Ditylenchus destructor]
MVGRTRRLSTSKPITSSAPTFASTSTFPHKVVLSFQTAQTYLNHPYIREMVEDRHVTLGWQHAIGVGQILRESINATVGQYRPNIDAIPLAIGKIEVKQPIYIVEDHTCIHLDISVQMIVFDCVPNNKPLTCRAELVAQNHVIGSIYGMISVKHEPSISGIKKGDNFDARFDRVSNSGELCQIIVRPLLTRKLADNDSNDDIEE